MLNPFSLENKTILITGASSGIGKATAILCSELGAKLLITGRNALRLGQVYSQLHRQDHMQLVVDFEDTNSVANLLDHIGKIDGIVHSAGIVDSTPLKFVTEPKLFKILKINFEVPFKITASLAKKKKLNKASSIVYISSLAAFNNISVGLSAYCASKGAISSSVRVMALELANQKIRVNAVCPGMIRTEMVESHSPITNEQLLEDEKRNYPLGYGRPEDVANAVAFLLSDAAKWITGTNMIIDGGASIH